MDEEAMQKWLEDERQDADRDIQEALSHRIQAGNAQAVEALKRLLRWHPECGFPENARPAYFDPGGPDREREYRTKQGLYDAPLCTEAYAYELWDKEDARTFLALLGQIARALGMEGLHDRRLR